MSPEKRVADPWRELFVMSVHDVQESRRRAGLPTNDLNLDTNDPKGNIEWTNLALDQLYANFDEEEAVEVLNRCAHVLPDDRIAELRELFDRTGSVRKVHSFWKKRFEAELRQRYPDVPEEWIRTVIDNDWGEAGRIDGNTIIATKVPQNIRGFFRADNLSDKRCCYCHCARIRDVFKSSEESIASSYCNCGGGFYRYNWERIIGRPVQVDVRSTILQGDDTCSFIIRIPVDIH